MLPTGVTVTGWQGVNMPFDACMLQSFAAMAVCAFAVTTRGVRENANTTIATLELP